VPELCLPQVSLYKLHLLLLLYYVFKYRDRVKLSLTYTGTAPALARLLELAALACMVTRGLHAAPRAAKESTRTWS
jgi:hypothetical protein